MDILRLVIIAVIPGIALSIGLYLTDRYDREPVRLLIKLFVFGMLSAIPTIIAERLLSNLNIFGGLLSIAWTAFIVAGLTEEYFKRLVVMKLAYYHGAFNEKLDGIIYCTFSALGFATIENIMYVVSGYDADPYIGLYRGLLSVPAHMLFAVTMGYYLSLAKFSPDNRTRSFYFKRSLVIPIFLHGSFNFILMAGIQLLMILFIPFVIFLWITNLKKLNKFYKESKMWSGS
ncbi:MAG: PrsW family intramembrane metalloprotease [Clostridiaceae bacterium]|jgi:RsiW-degrading membrane proteinase PrsW (M82 family)|nr:PrsW family intramembrane metalloprotease [Clostridiaceae bacterium]